MSTQTLDGADRRSLAVRNIRIDPGGFPENTVTLIPPGEAPVSCSLAPSSRSPVSFVFLLVGGGISVGCFWKVSPGQRETDLRFSRRKRAETAPKVRPCVRH